MTSSLLIAPFGTEFGAKVALLGGLMAMSALRPVVEPLLGRWLEPSIPDPAPVGQEDRRLAVARDLRAGLGSGAVAAVVGVAVLVGVAAAGAPARTVETVVEAEGLPDAAIPIDEIDPARVPAVTVDPEVGALDADLVDPEVARRIGFELVRAVDVEALALQRGDPDLLVAVDIGRRLVEVEDRVEAGAAGQVTVPAYDFDSMNLTIARVGPQSGTQPGIEARGTVVETTYDDGDEVGRAEAPFALTLALREGSDGRWLLADARPFEDPDSSPADSSAD